MSSVSRTVSSHDQKLRKEWFLKNFNVSSIVMKYGVKLLKILFPKQSEFRERNYGFKNEKFFNLISKHSLNIIFFCNFFMNY